MTGRPPGEQMSHIPPPTLRSLPARITYLSSFLSLNPADGLAIQASKPLIAPLIPTALDLVYTKLLAYDITAKAFVPPQAGGGSSADPKHTPTRPQDLHLTHAHIQYRKDFLKAYLIKLVSNEDWSPSSPLWDYMEKVGLIHTGISGGGGFAHRAKKPPLRVEYMHLGLLLGFVQDVIVGLVLDMDIDDEGLLDAEDKSREAAKKPKKKEIVLAWNKLLWIQNDLFARQYVVDEDTGESPVRGGWTTTTTTIRRKSALVTGVLGVMLGVASCVGYVNWM